VDVCALVIGVVVFPLGFVVLAVLLHHDEDD
jgi:hypothetical protein